MIIKNQLTVLFNISILLIACVNAIAQENLSEQQNIFKNGRLRSTDGFEIHFSKLIMDQDSLTYSKLNSKVDNTIPISKVIRVEVQKGSHALEFGAALALSGLIGSVIGVAQAESSSGGTIESGTKTNLIVGLTAASGLIGLLIGSSYKKYETVYANPKFGLKLNQIPIDIVFSEKSLLMKLSYHF